MDVKSRILDELESEDASVSVKSVGETSQIDQTKLFLIRNKEGFDKSTVSPLDKW